MRPGAAKPPPSVAGALFVPTVHGIRGLTMLVAVGFHVCGAAQWKANDAIVQALYEYAGPLALECLFFTTGFLLFLPVVRNGSLGSVRAFAIRRFARMAPAYYVCMPLVLALFPLLSTPAIESVADRGLDGILIHATFLRHPLAGLAIAVVASAAWRFAFLEPDARTLYEGLDYMIQAPLFAASLPVA